MTFAAVMAFFKAVFALLSNPKVVDLIVSYAAARKEHGDDVAATAIEKATDAFKAALTEKDDIDALRKISDVTTRR